MNLEIYFRLFLYFLSPVCVEVLRRTDSCLRHLNNCVKDAYLKIRYKLELIGCSDPDS